MIIESKPITGNETIADQDSPVAALTRFYFAFNQRDMSQMQTNWLHNEEASMSNPLGGVKRGWKEIESVYQRIFNGAAKVYVEFFDYTIHATETMFIAVGRETGCLELNNTKIDLAIRTSRAFRRQNDEWRQIHHHGSMDKPELLSLYQNTLLN